MNKYVISLVFARTVPAPSIVSSVHKANKPPDVDIQNEVGITMAQSPEEAYRKVVEHVKEKYREYRLINQIVIDITETAAEDVN